jgi:hypothetical protein
MKVEEFLRLRHNRDTSLNQEEDALSDGGSKGRIAAGTRSQANDEAVKYQIRDIERRINRANEKRLEAMSHHLEKSQGY